MTRDPRPVLFVTGHAPADRTGAFALLAEREHVRFALFGGRVRHAGGEPDALPFDHVRVSQREIGRLAGGGDHRAVICGTGGRVALPAAYRGARRAGVPFILWASLWAQPKGPAGIAGTLPLRRIYRGADAVVTYGPHVSAYVTARGAHTVFEAPQAVDNAFWSAAADPALERRAPFQAMFAGRLEREKGIEVLLDAWRRLEADPARAALVLVGQGPPRISIDGASGVIAVGRRDPVQLRNFYAGSDVVVLASIPTLTFREPWGLVINEAMNQSRPVITTDAVGAAAGGLVRDGVNGLVVPAGDPRALAGAIERLRDDRALAAGMGAQGRADVAAYTYDAWARGFTSALAATRAARGD
jgi:glycosyltransferase involved in cell wall biosynthesis